MSEPRAFERDKLIRFHYCDPAGIVFFPQYFVLFNELVEDWFNEGLGMEYARLIATERLGVPMVHIECDFVSPSKIGETLRLELRVERMGGSSLHLAVTGGAKGETRVRAKLVVVFASIERMRAVRIPQALREKIERFVC